MQQRCVVRVCFPTIAAEAANSSSSVLIEGEDFRVIRVAHDDRADFEIGDVDPSAACELVGPTDSIPDRE